ncbi:MAG: hypothetical protein PHP75_09495 [Methylacidiphilaceae bacterium]|nr:hypothetical protein [Candidatus Methylacidiphilaceae bacterium]
MRWPWFEGGVRFPRWLAIWAFPIGSLHLWVKDAQGGQAFSDPKTLTAESPEQRELRRLRQEKDYLRRQRDILKKALGILSAEMPASDMR